MSDWPELSVERDHETLAMLHLAAQMLGKIRVAHAPWVNHGWHVALQPNARGLATLPTAASGGRTFTLTLDLCRHAIVLWVSDEAREELPLNAGSVAALHRRLIAMLDRHGLPSRFNGVPERDAGRGAVRRGQGAARLRPRFRRALPRGARGDAAAVRAVSRRLHAARRARSISGGAASTLPSRASRAATAPPHPGGIPGLPDRITREAYSQEVSSAGFWAGGVTAAEPFFYSYVYPEPGRLSRRRSCSHGRFDETYGEFVLPYAEVRAAADPARMLGEFSAVDLRSRPPISQSGTAPALEREPVAP